MEKYEETDSVDPAELFGDAVSQESLESFLAECAEEESSSEAQGSLVTAIVVSFVYRC